MANSVGPTSGTVVAFIGGIAGPPCTWRREGGELGSVLTLAVAGICYVLAGSPPLRLSRSSLGPTPAEAAEQGSVGCGLENVAQGLVACLKASGVAGRREGRTSGTGAHRFLYGILLLMSVLCTEIFLSCGNANTALAYYGCRGHSFGGGLGSRRLADPARPGGWPTELDHAAARRGRWSPSSGSLPPGRVRRIGSARGRRPGNRHLDHHDSAAEVADEFRGLGVLGQRHALQRDVRARRPSAWRSCRDWALGCLMLLDRGRGYGRGRRLPLDPPVSRRQSRAAPSPIAGLGRPSASSLNGASWPSGPSSMPQLQQEVVGLADQRARLDTRGAP